MGVNTESHFHLLLRTGDVPVSLGDGDFVDDVSSQAEEHLEERYRLQAKGYDLEKLIERVGELLEMSPEEIMERGN